MTQPQPQGSFMEKKLGHREIKHGVVHYKKVSSDELKKAIQFGIVHFISEQNRMNSRFNIDRDLLMQDFQVVETILFPRNGIGTQPPHNYNDFKLKVYAPYGFKYLRKKFYINETDFMKAIGETELKDVSNPGASGSVFYKTSDDKFILKTVQHEEAEFLKTLLAAYTLNLLQNLINGKNTLLPKIYGLFCYQRLELTSLLSDKTNIRIVIMNNILPSDVPIHEKYDLKGSLYKRKASKQERAKSSPTYKDLDFLEMHPDGIFLDERNYEIIISSVKRDCLILQSLGIMDYSLLLGIHNLDKEAKTNTNQQQLEEYFEAKLNEQNQMDNQQAQSSTLNIHSNASNNNMVSLQSSFRSTTLPQVQSNQNKNYENLYKTYEVLFNVNATPARSAKGERLLLYLGIIDILQSYRLRKRLEHTFKSMITDGKQISVCHPTFYANRFIEFLQNKVFRKTTLKSSPSRKRTTIKSTQIDDTATGLNTSESTTQQQQNEQIKPKITINRIKSDTNTQYEILNEKQNNNEIKNDFMELIDEDDERDSGINVNTNSSNSKKLIKKQSPTIIQNSSVYYNKKYKSTSDDEDDDADDDADDDYYGYNYKTQQIPSSSSSTTGVNNKILNEKRVIEHKILTSSSMPRSNKTHANKNYEEKIKNARSSNFELQLWRYSDNSNATNNNNDLDKFKLEYHKLIHLQPLSVTTSSNTTPTTSTINTNSDIINAINKKNNDYIEPPINVLSNKFETNECISLITTTLVSEKIPFNSSPLATQHQSQDDITDTTTATPTTTPTSTLQTNFIKFNSDSFRFPKVTIQSPKKLSTQSQP